jgi:hypothetical protein
VIFDPIIRWRTRHRTNRILQRAGWPRHARGVLTEAGVQIVEVKYPGGVTLPGLRLDKARPDSHK